ncbi:MAG TPA: flagellar motor protein MotB [Gammaproteobacteria bacterium]|nr:flagellar motor protein MotB [Gammaproteobacteria bacterium]
MKKPRKEKDESERWMVSYADLLTLLLAFFIVMYAMSQRDVSKYKIAAESIMRAFHGTPPKIASVSAPSGHGILHHQPSPVPRPVEHPAPHAPHLSRRMQRQVAAQIEALHKAEKELKSVLGPLVQKHQVKLLSEPMSLRIRLNAQILFPSGTARLSPDARKVIDKIAQILATTPQNFNIVVQGFTNSRPIHTSRFRSNWELSADRAVNVVHLFRNSGIKGRRLAAEGFSHYHSIAPNHTARGLRLNRRVEILIRAPDSARHRPADVRSVAPQGPADTGGKTTPAAGSTRVAGHGD